MGRGAYADTDGVADTGNGGGSDTGNGGATGTGKGAGNAAD